MVLGGGAAVKFAGSTLLSLVLPEQGKIRSQDTELWEGKRLGVLAICALVLGRGTRKRGSCICETGLAFSLTLNLTLVILQQ